MYKRVFWPGVSRGLQAEGAGSEQSLAGRDALADRAGLAKLGTTPQKALAPAVSSLRAPLFQIRSTYGASFSLCPTRKQQEASSCQMGCELPGLTFCTSRQHHQILEVMGGGGGSGAWGVASTRSLGFLDCKQSGVVILT